MGTSPGDGEIGDESTGILKIAGYNYLRDAERGAICRILDIVSSRNMSGTIISIYEALPYPAVYTFMALEITGQATLTGAWYDIPVRRKEPPNGADYLDTSRIYSLDFTFGISMSSGTSGTSGTSGSSGSSGTSVSVTNPGDNKVLTSDGTSTGIIAETNLLFHNSTNILNVTGSVVANNYTGSMSAGTPSFIGLVSSASFYEVFTSGQTWYKKPWAQRYTIIAIGGGGGGGGGCTATTAATIKTGGGGGGGGEVIVHTYRASELPNSVTITVGAGGGGGLVGDPSGARGNNGGSTVFGSTSEQIVGIVARGGFGGEGGRLGHNSSVTLNTLSTTTKHLYDHYGNNGIIIKTIPSSIMSLGGGAGGFGGLRREFATSSATSTDEKMSLINGAPLPYTVAHAAVHSSFLSQASIGIPNPITTTGGGGGSGVDTNGGTYGGGGAGGSVLTSVTASLGLNNYWYAIPNTYTRGMVNYDITQAVSEASPKNYKFMGTSIGLGGRGGSSNNNVAPVKGGDYGGGGGGGGANNNANYGTGASGGDGVLIVISEA